MNILVFGYLHFRALSQQLNFIIKIQSLSTSYIASQNSPISSTEITIYTCIWLQNYEKNLPYFLFCFREKEQGHCFWSLWNLIHLVLIIGIAQSLQKRVFTRFLVHITMLTLKWHNVKHRQVGIVRGLNRHPS